MPGLLRRLFAPRWRHPDPGVRRQAAANLDADNDSQRQTLERLAVDDDSGVRHAALERLDDATQLLTLRDQHGESVELRERLLMLLTGRAGHQDLEHRTALVEALNDSSLLSRIALEGDNQQLRLAALARLTGEDELIRQARDNGIAAVRHAAAERITSEQGLARLASEARRDRRVMRRARDRLNQMRADAASLARARQRRESLLEQLEAHAASPWEPMYAGRFRHLTREWERLEDIPDNEQERRYQDASLRCRKVISDHEAHEHAQDVAEQQREDADQARESLVEALEESLEGLRHGDRLADQDIASLRSQKQLMASRWQALSDKHLADDALRQRYDAALTDFDRIVQARVRLDERADALQEAIDIGDDERLGALIDACQWPDDLPPSPLLRRAREQLEQQQVVADDDLAARLTRFHDDLDQLEQLLESGAFKGASRLHQRLRQQAEELPAKRIDEGRLKRLGARLAELRDWRGFVAGPKRDQLCQDIESLAHDDTLGHADLDRRHRRLIKEWKGLGDAAANHEQAARFRRASDQVHERLKPWRAEQDAQRQRNLEAREALCEQLEQLIEQPSQQADPDALREIRDRARQQWRHHSPVPRDQSEAVGRRFGRIRHQLQALIEQRANTVADAKRQLIDEARQLRDSGQDPVKRADNTKQLQKRWRALGRAPRHEERALWKEFRHICDEIFARRDAARRDQAKGNQARLDAMQALVERMDAWQPSSSDDAATLDQAVNEALALEPLPHGRRSEGMRKRWSGIIRARRDRLERLAQAEEVQRFHAIRPLLDAHLEADAASLTDDTPRDVTPPGTAELSSDVKRAHQQRNTARRSPPAADDIEEHLERIRVHLALLAGGQVAQRDDPLRLAIQVERLNDNLGKEPTRAEELREVLCELLATGPIPPELWQREVGELDRTLESLTQLPPP